MKVRIEQAHVTDAEEILRLQRLAYLSEAAIYGDVTIPPLIQTIDEMERDFAHKLFLKAIHDGQIIGSVRAYIDGGTCFVGRLIVHPDHQNQGIGFNLMREIESRFREVARFELFTGHKSARNLYLYEKLGYRPCRREVVNDDLVLVFLERHARPSDRHRA